MLKLTLKNFKCYENKEFLFDKGFTLIEGQSGTGKTTILQAIIFVLYGKGTNLKMIGKTSCSVQLEFENLTVLRSKSPNKLLVNDIIEGDEAQSLINTKFGDTFENISYISQTSLNSFILMKPDEKLEFLEKFVFNDIDLSNIKVRNKAEINKRKDDLSKTIHNLELTIKMFEEIEEPLKVDFPIKSSQNNYEKIAKNEQIKLKNCNVRIKKLKNEITKLQEEYNDLKILNTFIKDKHDNIDNLSSYLNVLSLEEQNSAYNNQSLIEYKERLKILLSKNKLVDKKEQFLENSEKLDLMKNVEINKYTKDLNDISNNLWKEYSREECENIIEETKEYLKDAKLISSYKNRLKEYFVDTDELSIKKLERDTLLKEIDIFKKKYNKKFIYNCPSCDSKLQIIDNILSIHEDNILEEDLEMNIQEIETNIKNRENKLKKLDNFIITQEDKLEKFKKIEKEMNDILSQYEDEIDEDILNENLENIKIYYDFQIKQEKKIIDVNNILSTENFSSSLKIFSKGIDKLKLEIKELENICGENYEILKEEELRNLIIKEERNKETIDRLLEEKNKRHEELLKNKKNIETLKQDHINKYQKINNDNDIQSEIKNKEKQILDQENDINIHTENLIQIDKYNKYMEDFKKYSDFKNKINVLENTEKEDRKKYNAAILLKEKILEAESIAILNIIEIINNHSQIYLEYFFIENPILVKLKSFKETKKDNKPQINIDIEYKGMETDLSSLSGGELSRVILAFTLALSEIFNSPILLLDESTASLDQDTTTIVFEAIKENFKNKIVLIVAHQVVLGIFDKIIKIC